MIRSLPLAAAAFALFFAQGGATPVLASCETGGLINTCLDEPIGGGAAEGEEEAYERLDGGGFGGRPPAAETGKTITIGDTTVTLGPNKEAESWQSFSQETDDEIKAAREDKVKGASGSLDPLQTQCHADGCY